MGWLTPSWRDEPMTANQKRYIEIIQECMALYGLGEFNGTTKGEASDYISRYKASYKEMQDVADFEGEMQAMRHEDAGDRI